MTPSTGTRCQERVSLFFFFPIYYKLIKFKLVHSYIVKHLTCIIFCSSGLQNIFNVTPRIPVRPDRRIRTGFRDARLRTGTLDLKFFFQNEPNWHLWVWPTSYNRIRILYTNQKNYHRSGVHQIYTHITESHLLIQN